MSAIVKELTIAATPERVFAALTQQAGLARWWTDDLNVTPEVGSLAEFRFRQGAAIFQLEITKLDAEKEVGWIFRKGPPSWAGTTITWQLAPISNGTELIFTHAGFVRVDETFEQISRNWAYFLNSLKSYLETGQGNPGFPT